MTFAPCQIFCAALLTRFAPAVEIAKAKSEEALLSIGEAALTATPEELEVWTSAIDRLTAPKDAIEQVISYLPNMPRSAAEQDYRYRQAWSEVEIRNAHGRVVRAAAT
jgi:hypothetical protein